MRGTRKKQIRRLAELQTAGKDKAATRLAAKKIKRLYHNARHPKRPPAVATGFFLSRPASIQRQQQIAARFDQRRA